MSPKYGRFYRVKYGKRQVRKARLMYRILCELPATFSVLQMKVKGRGKTGRISSKTLWYRLTELLELGVITKVCNLYEYKPRVELPNNPSVHEIPSEQDFLMEFFMIDDSHLVRETTRGYVPGREAIRSWETPLAHPHTAVQLSPKLVNKLDKMRGNVPLSLFVEKIVKKHIS